MGELCLCMGAHKGYWSGCTNVRVSDFKISANVIYAKGRI